MKRIYKTEKYDQVTYYSNKRKAEDVFKHDNATIEWLDDYAQVYSASGLIGSIQRIVVN